MAAFTTIIGFLSLLTSQVYPIKYFGIFTSFGIFVTFALALWFLPSWVILFGYRVQNISSKKPRKKTGKVSLSAGNITQILLNKKRTVFIITAVVVAFSIYGVTKVWINSSFLANFEKDSDIVLTDKFVNSKFGGTSTLNVILESEEYDAFKQPDALTLIDEMQHEAVKLSRVGNSFSLADYLKRMNKVMNADSDEFYTIPETSDMVAQYLLLYEMSGDPENLVRIINYDYNRTNVTFQLKGDDSQTINEALTVIKKFEKPLGDMGVSINYAGSGYKALVFTDLILEGQIKSILVSLVLVLLLLTFMFKSIKAGLIGSTPIAITALISFGVMGALNIPLSTTTALLSSIAIGIGIDYAIHFLQNYRMNLKTESNQLDAIKTTMLHTGKAITFNAVVVISGFLVLLFSVFPPNRTLGALVSMNMFTSFLGTLTLLMILVFGFKVFIKKNNSTKVEKKSRL
jgi:predicted RND superfamily exporter protein